MLRNYLKTAWRSLKANKFYSLINISGLAIGLATGIMLLLWVQNEKSYDKFNNDYRNIYKLSAHFLAGGKEVTWTGVPGPLASFARSMPQVKSLVRVKDDWDQIIANSDRSKVLDGYHIAYVDSSFLSIFDFKLIKGNKPNIFPNVNSVVLTQSTARKIFGDENAMGKIIVYDKTNFTVTGVLENFPENSSLQYDAIFPMSVYAQKFTENGGNGSYKTIDADLGNYAFAVYVRLGQQADPVKIGQQFSEAFKRARNGDSKAQFKLQNLADIHLTGADGNDSALRMVQIFMLVAILLLVIAAINYINLSTARSLVRANEVSIRKIVGANKLQLFFQFIIETFLLFCVATAISFVLITLFMPLYNQISGKNLHFSLANIQVWKMIGYAIVGTLLAASIYPAVLLSSFLPIQSLKRNSTSGIGTVLFRKMLVVFQFAISVILIASTLVISRQMQYVRSKNLGYDKSYVFTVPLTDNIVTHIDAVKNEMDKHSYILNTSVSDISDISNIISATSDIDWQGKPSNSNLILTQVSVDSGFIPTMKIQFLEGGNFSGTPADSTHFILNETAVREMGLEQPYVGQQIIVHGQEGAIIGVVKDFNFKPLKEAVTPLIFFTQRRRNILYVRTTAKDAQQAIAEVKGQYERYASDIPFSYNFVDKQFEAKYTSDRRTSMLFRLFAGIAIFISCLGLFGLATYTAQVKRKEIGIRKVLGSSVGDIVGLISRGFVKLVVIAIIIAVPMAWWVTHNWLQGFAYRIAIPWWVFPLTAAIAIGVAMCTVSAQAIRAAVANPIKSLRTE